MMIKFTCAWKNVLEVSCLIEFLKRNTFLRKRLLEFSSKFSKRLITATTQEYAIEIWSLRISCFKIRVMNLTSKLLILDSQKYLIPEVSMISYLEPGDTLMKTGCGTPYYISPEVLTHNYSEACDMWSAGCILYVLLCGYPPFYGDDDWEIIESVRKGVFDFPLEEWEDVSDEAKDLIKKLIAPPELRLTSHESLKHPWIKSLAKTQKKEKLTHLDVNTLQKY